MLLSLRAIRLSLGTQIIALIISLVLAAVIALTSLSVWLFRNDNTLLVQQLNAHEAAALAMDIREVFSGLVEKSERWGALLAEGVPTEERKVKLGQILEREPDILAVALARREGGKLQMLSSVFTRSLASKEGSFALEPILPVVVGEVALEPVVTTISLPGNGNVVVLMRSLGSPEALQLLYVLLRPERIQDVFMRLDGVSAYLVDREGKKIADSVKRAEVASDFPGLAGLLKGSLTNKQVVFTEPTSRERRMAAFKQVGFAGLAVISEMPESVALEASERMIKLAFLVAFVIFCAATLTGAIYSGFLVAPILTLTRATAKVAAGELKTRVSVPFRGGNEIASLGRAFNSMALGLEEREKFRDTFIKFHSREVAEKLLSGEVKLGGEKLEAIVLFSDLRGFTALSENLPPEAVVEMLNEYLARMVRVIRANGGVIDKFVGDSIMATWGVPFATPGNADQAIRASLEMRSELAALNLQKRGLWHEPLRMGVGLNRGLVIAGNIGSEERMEYTVIGDAVNLASRIESLTKDLGVDILLTESVQKAAIGKFSFQPMPNMKIRGKAEEVRVFTLSNAAAGSGLGRVG